MAPKPPPTSGAITRTCSSARPSAAATAARTANGICVDAHTVSRPSGASGCATTPRGSIGIAATRGTWSRASTTAYASAKPRATSPTAPSAGPATLSGHSSKTRGAFLASAASTVAAAGRLSYRTSTAWAASAAR
ncbi:MAG: hypothetical protein DMD96_01700 [Candidatus Rokuibacteriota bacterium]|nr:MAG: hypothetical protein DMD96_01700 [Candidatus Rokubacteria bacterium]